MKRFKLVGMALYYLEVLKFPALEHWKNRRRFHRALQCVRRVWCGPLDLAPYPPIHFSTFKVRKSGFGWGPIVCLLPMMPADDLDLCDGDQPIEEDCRQKLSQPFCEVSP